MKLVKGLIGVFGGKRKMSKSWIEKRKDRKKRRIRLLHVGEEVVYKYVPDYRIHLLTSIVHFN